MAHLFLVNVYWSAELREIAITSASGWRLGFGPSCRVSIRLTSINRSPRGSLTVQAASAHARVQKASTTQLTQPSYLAHALCANKLFHKQDVFGHRAILIFPGIETWLGGFK